MLHALVEIPQTEWPELRDLYEGQKKFTCAYNTIQCLIEWKTQNEELDIKIHSLDGDWRRDGTYVAIHKKPYNQVFINTLSENQERLLTALKMLNNKGNLNIFAYPERLIPTVEKFVLAEGLKKENFLADGTAWYHIDMEKAKQLPVHVPEGFTLRRLETKHAEQVNSVWPHWAPGTVIFVERMIAYNDSVGVFDSAGNLVAWSLRLPIGALGLVQVVDTHKRLGLGSLVVSEISKLIASKGLEVTAPVIFENAASRSMFEKLGFKPIDNVYWTPVPERT
ncbi:uncharacterized protein LOC118740497 [Rhagoletis pomonella]|uniref:uncharacterized protein LOC118740497 n=1 Tax=Rhagoletis pomonella TaxID=28610 RepID=UPI0017808C3A|nr:uncharacterized protein LOC118740497 [Rhagoletis pomonella]